jgi:DNA/RNA endonuclease YhcR with UshA esterase domain
MKPTKIFFLLTLIGILILMFLTQMPNNQNGTIESIKYSENKITIQLENINETLIIFDSRQLNLKIGDEITFNGKYENYRGEKQIIVDKITKKT